MKILSKIQEALLDVANMMLGYGQTVRNTPTVKIDLKEKQLRVALIEEETKELLDAIHLNKLDKIADGVADVIVVTLGAAAAYGIPIEDVWNEVIKTNLAKIGGPKDPITGKHLKPPGWKPPDIKRILRNHGWNENE